MSAGALDEFVINLGLNPKPLQDSIKGVDKGFLSMQKNADKHTKAMSASAKGLAMAFGGVRSSLLGVAGIAFGGAYGLKEFFGSMITGQAELGRNAHNLGMNVRELDAMGAMAESVGGKAESMTGWLKSAQASMQGLAMGQESPFAAALYSLGVAYTDNNGKIRPMIDIMRDLRKEFEKMPDTQTQVFAASRLGMDDATLALMQRTSAEFENLYSKMYEASGANNESAAAAQRSQAALAQFERQLKGVGQTIFDSFTPELEGAISELNQFSGWISANKGDIYSFFGGLMGFARGLTTQFFELSGSIIDAMGKFYNESPNTGVVGWLKKQAQGVGGFLSEFGGDMANSAMNIAQYGGYNPKKTMGTERDSKAVPGGSPAQRQKLAMLDKANNFPAGTMDAIWNIESSRGRKLVSSKAKETNFQQGASGHFMFMKGARDRFGLTLDESLHDFDKAAEAAAKYIAANLKRYGGDMNKAILAYNQGEGTVDKLGYEGTLKAKPEGAQYIQNYMRAVGSYSQNRFQTAQQAAPTQTVDVHVGTITVHTAATDASGIARDIHKGMRDNSMVFAGMKGAS